MALLLTLERKHQRKTHGHVAVGRTSVAAANGTNAWSRLRRLPPIRFSRGRVSGSDSIQSPSASSSSLLDGEDEQMKGILIKDSRMLDMSRGICGKRV